MRLTPAKPAGVRRIVGTCFDDHRELHDSHAAGVPGAAPTDAGFPLRSQQE